eukprot:jgi/Picsp_1/4414/NSC_06636-R1_---NA---
MHLLIRINFAMLFCVTYMVAAHAGEPCSDKEPCEQGLWCNRDKSEARCYQHCEMYTFEYYCNDYGYGYYNRDKILTYHSIEEAQITERSFLNPMVKEPLRRAMYSRNKNK